MPDAKPKIHPRLHLRGKTFACCFLIAAFVISQVSAATEPRSSVGNVDCGKDFPVTRICVVATCSSDSECVLPSSTIPALPGGLGYGCLADAGVCGWKFPSAQ